MKKAQLALSLAAAGCLLCAGPYAMAQTAGADTKAGNSSPSPVLSPAQAAQRFHEAEALERKHGLRAAFDAYLAAGEAGNGLAQKKLGDIYSSGSPAVERDYETALKWYHKAREQGIEIPKPLSYPGMPVNGSSR